MDGGERPGAPGGEGYQEVSMSGLDRAITSAGNPTPVACSSVAKYNRRAGADADRRQRRPLSTSAVPNPSPGKQLYP